MGLHPHNTAQLHRTATPRGCTKSWKPNPWGLGPESCPGSLGWHCWERVPRSQGVRVPTRAKRGCKGAGMACDLIAALSLSSLDPGRKRGHVAVIVLGKQTNLRRDREQLLGYRCYQGNGCGLPARSAAPLEQGPARGGGGRKERKVSLGCQARLKERLSWHLPRSSLLARVRRGLADQVWEWGKPGLALADPSSPSAWCLLCAPCIV